MSGTILEETMGRVRVAPLKVEQYEAMIDRGILSEGEPIELLDGLLVWKDRAKAGENPMTVGTEHALVVSKLMRLQSKIEKLGCHLKIQSPIRVPPTHEPEPDGALVAGDPEDYAKRHPGPDQVFCVIEVSDSSLVRDRTSKLRIYAAAGIRQYVIVNLIDRVVEVYSSPVPAEGRYATEKSHARAQAFALAAGPRRTLEIRAKDLLP